MHDFLYSICGTKCERFSSVQVQAYPENCYISHKTKAVQFSPIPLDVYFLPMQMERLPQGVFSARICASNRSASVKPIRKAATSTKSKAVQFPPYRLMFIFSNADGTTATWRFLYSNLYIESLRQRQAYSESCYIHEKQSGTVFTHTA